MAAPRDPIDLGAPICPMEPEGGVDGTHGTDCADEMRNPSLSGHRFRRKATTQSAALPANLDAPRKLNQRLMPTTTPGRLRRNRWPLSIGTHGRVQSDDKRQSGERLIRLASRTLPDLLWPPNRPKGARG